MIDEKKELTPGIGAEAKAINEAFDKTGVTFHDRAATLAAFKEGREIVNEDGQLFTRYDGEAKVPLSNALLRYAYDNRAACDGRSLPRTGAGLSRPGMASKSDFTTTRQKLDYIAAHGADAWERLPLTGVATSEVLTQSDWYKLPRAERVRLTALDENYFAKLAPAPQPRPTGAYINTEGIERHLSTRGKLAK